MGPINRMDVTLAWLLTQHVTLFLFVIFLSHQEN